MLVGMAYVFFSWIFEMLWFHRKTIGICILVYGIIKYLLTIESRLASLEYEAQKRNWEV